MTFFKKIRLPQNSLRLFNNFLTLVVAGLALYIIAAPFLPQAGWWIKHDSSVKAFVRDNAAGTATAGRKVQGDKLFIPRLDMEEAIYTGGVEALKKGVWLRPHASTPDRGGNTVIVGHRFTYRGQAVFYHLDKVKKGDLITLHWQGKVYEYEVSEIKVVPATELSVEDNTRQPQLTIYTCTPLWSTENRLVVIAQPMEAGS